MSKKHSGSCLCGQVRFEVEGSFDSFFLCHCEYCRKDTGTAHAANIFSSTAALTWVSGRDNVRQFHLPATRHARAFCSTCGSALPYLPADGGTLVVPAGSLDTQVDISPNAHLFTSSRANWDDQLERVPAFATFPS
jgi:hypothetical protein